MECGTIHAGGEIPSEDFMRRLVEGERGISWVYIYVKGYDTSLPEEDIREALTNHFASCGDIFRIEIPKDLFNPDDSDRCALILFAGEDVQGKALALSGSEVGGRKILVKFVPPPEILWKDVPSGSTTVPAT